MARSPRFEHAQVISGAMKKTEPRDLDSVFLLGRLTKRRKGAKSLLLFFAVLATLREILDQLLAAAQGVAGAQGQHRGGQRTQRQAGQRGRRLAGSRVHAAQRPPRSASGSSAP